MHRVVSPRWLLPAVSLALACARLEHREVSGPAPRPASCGDVTPFPGAPTFEAIKRLATTTSEVRILVYGQSQSEQPWWQMVKDWLGKRYPSGNLVMEQHARGGCASQCLIGREPWFIDERIVNRVPEDVFEFHPDLIIFSVFGRHDDFETLIEGFKTGCSAFDDHPSATAHCEPAARYPRYRGAEVLLQTYVREDDRSYAPTLPALPPIPEGEWDHWMATVWIPSIARKYGGVVQPLWEAWGDYLQSHHQKAADLMPDGEHFNDAGNTLLARLTEQFLCYPGAR
jgi:hypothetical protein